MKKRFLFCALACALGFTLLGFAGCDGGGETPPDEGKHTHTYVDGICECGKYEADFLSMLPMAPDLQVACDEAGTVVDFSYETRAYALEALDDSEAEIPMTKTVQVYLPYGYDASKQYNILYLQHGAGETYTYWLTDMGATTRNVLDNMIKDGKCEPVIVVAPTVYSQAEGYEELWDSADWTGNFPQEFRNDIVPAVEQEYSTYAGGDVSEENLIASRDHRAFAGFSMGSVTSIEIMKNCADMLSYVGSYSAGSDGAAVSEALHSDAFNGYDIKHWFNQNGTADFALSSQQEMVAYVRESLTDKFQDGKNFAYIEIPGGSHAYNCWIIGLYNSMLVFYR